MYGFGAEPHARLGVVDDAPHADLAERARVGVMPRTIWKPKRRRTAQHAVLEQVLVHRGRVVCVQRGDRQRLVRQADVRRERGQPAGDQRRRVRRRERDERRRCRARRPACRGRRGSSGRRRSRRHRRVPSVGVARRSRRRRRCARWPSFSVRSTWASSGAAATSAPSPATSTMLTGWSSSSVEPVGDVRWRSRCGTEVPPVSACR